MRRCCSPRPTRPPPAGGLELLSPAYDDAADPAALGRWVARAIAEREPDALLVDAFPGGVLGEPRGLGALAGLELHHTARLLRWGVYARRCEGPLPPYDAAAVVEPRPRPRPRARGDLRQRRAARPARAGGRAGAGTAGRAVARREYGPRARSAGAGACGR